MILSKAGRPLCRVINCGFTVTQLDVHDRADEVGEVGCRADLQLRDLAEELILEAVVPDGGRDIETRQGRALLAYQIINKTKV